MKRLILVLVILIVACTSAFTVTQKKHAVQPKMIKNPNLKVRYYITDMDHNPTVHFTVGETYNVYLSIQNMTADSIRYSHSDGIPLFHFIALKSADTDYQPNFNNQVESLQIPIAADQDTVLASHEIIDEYQQIQFFAPGFYTIQIMPNVIFPDKYKKDWGTLKFEVECHGNPNISETDPLKDIMNSEDLAPLLEKLKDLPELQNPDDAQ